MGLSKSPKGGSLKPLLPVLPETWLVTVCFFFQFCKPGASRKFCFSFCSSMPPPHHMHIGNFQKWQSWKNSAVKVLPFT